eukprot:3141410-Pyramimonas_sp.AAC.1
MPPSSGLLAAAAPLAAASAASNGEGAAWAPGGAGHEAGSPASIVAFCVGPAVTGAWTAAAGVCGA